MSVKIRLKPIEQTIFKGQRFKDVNISNILVNSTRKDLEAIRNRIGNIFSWTVGTRVLFPTLGNALEQLKYEPLNDVTVENARTIVGNMMAFEPEVTVQNIIVQPNPERNELNIRVNYNVPKLDVKQVFDFYVLLVGGSRPSYSGSVGAISRVGRSGGGGSTGSTGGGSAGGGSGGGSSGGGGGGGY